MFRALNFFSRNQNEQKEDLYLLGQDQDAQKLLNDLDKEISSKKMILFKVLAASVIGSLGGLAIYFMKQRSDYLSDYIQKQQSPDTWDKPCGDIVAGIADRYGQGYNLAGCPRSLFVSEYPYSTLENESPECYDWCIHLPREGRVIGLVFAMILTGMSVFSAIACVVSMQDPTKMNINDLSETFQEKVNNFLLSHNYDNHANMSVNELRDILNKEMQEQEEDLETKSRPGPG